MPLGRAILVLILLLIPSFSGCTLLHQTKFTVLTQTIDDIDGFTFLTIQFNTSDISTLTVIDSEHTTLFSDTYYAGIHTEHIPLADYRTTIIPGTYTIMAVDASKQTIFQNDLLFRGCNLSLISTAEDWWADTTDATIVAFHLRVQNTGDLPAYPFEICVTTAETSIRSSLIPTVITPSQTTQIPCFLPLSNLSSTSEELTVSLFDSRGIVLAQSTVTVTQQETIESWVYQWHHLGSQSLKIPEVNWFYDHYTGLERFGIIDYAAYVFDRHDDRYIEFLVHQLLSRENLKTDVEKINHVASFVQSLEYTKDDPENESYEYPRYPLETLKDRRGDCEDKAILTAALLDSLGYNVSLIRLPHHMAVGVHLDETLPVYSYYIDQYYFLETTTLFMPLGSIPLEYQGLSNVTVYPISSRPLLFHSWKNATRYEISTGADYVTVTMIIENLGTIASSNVEVRAAFYDNASSVYNLEVAQVPLIVAGGKSLLDISVDVPALVSTTLKTQVFLNGNLMHDCESTSRFP